MFRVSMKTITPHNICNAILVAKCSILLLPSPAYLTGKVVIIYGMKEKLTSYFILYLSILNNLYYGITHGKKRQ
nr:MAG TPA: hypothetical protein [Caudoviricetes sp.]